MDQSSKNMKKRLDTLCGIAFFLASFSGKVQYLPLTPLTPVAILFSLLCYLAGYSLWLASSFFSPDQLPKIESWYGFASFKEQCSYAAFLGIIGSLITLASLAFPPLSMLAVWTFFASNTFWSISEYHKYKNPSEDTTYSASAQKSFVYYALSVTLIGFISAASLTLIIFFPPLVIPMGVFSMTLNTAATITALTYWYDYTFGNHHESKSVETEDVSTLSPAVFEIERLPKNNPSKEPHHLSSLFHSPKSDKLIPEDQTFSCLSSR
ncbi:MAG: hypothetical protein CK426_04290 [Legionella sp.]|nr:MAG: hypothetical protein CK423_03540 [Legionella sp.]PJD98906.1 MAG: hypothetical protein CK426_04290 [Legionella sp.]